MRDFWYGYLESDELYSFFVVIRIHNLHYRSGSSIINDTDVQTAKYL